jgi:hypothetical protein
MSANLHDVLLPEITIYRLRKTNEFHPNNEQISDKPNLE